MAKKALITGINGQDGSYLTKLLLEKGYEVFGMKRRASMFNTIRIDEFDIEANLRYGDLTDLGSIIRLLEEVQPDEIYHLGAMSHVGISFNQPEYVANCDGIGTLRILDAIRLLKMDKQVKMYNAATSELFGGIYSEPQNEETPFHPRSPYASAKAFAFYSVQNYREMGLFASNGILFNHESPFRSAQFVTKKITRKIAQYAHWSCVREYYEPLMLGNINAKRDWGHAKDYVRGMYMILQHDKPDDFVLGTGIQYSVKNLVDLAFAIVDIPIEWEITDTSFKAIDQKRGITVVQSNEHYLRPTDVESLCADYSKAKRELGWEPEYTFNQLIEEMIQYDLSVIEKNKHQPMFVG